MPRPDPHPLLARGHLHSRPLIGRRLAAVEYFDSIDDHGAPVTYARPEDPFHVLNHGIDLIFSDGLRCGFGWHGQFHLEVFPDGMATTVRHGPVDVSHLPVWQARIGGRIRSVRIAADFDPTEGPCDALIEFDPPTPPVWISARAALQDPPFDPNGDDAVISFTPADARRIGITLMPEP